MLVDHVEEKSWLQQLKYTTQPPWLHCLKSPSSAWALITGKAEKPFSFSLDEAHLTRIGALGFLPSFVTQEQGLLNLGLHDQVFLLQWIQENIEEFGGDKNDVTIFGLSAGAHSVCPFLSSDDQSNHHRSDTTSSTTKKEQNHCSTKPSWNLVLPPHVESTPTMRSCMKINSRCLSTTRVASVSPNMR